MKTCPKCGNEYPDTTTLCPADGFALEKSGDSLLGRTLAGKYRIEEKLSEGGMGTVYRGTHVLMDKTVAVKVLRPSLAADEKIVARFSREARAASRISHPHALSVTDFGEDEDGVVFLVMEYLSGKTLKELIREDGPLPLARVVDIIKQVAGALDAAHEQGVVHRDLKSDNIMLVSTNAGDYAKVLDFGIAKIKEPEGEYDPGLTAPDLVIGTPQYMSPEQCSQSPDIDARSDVYSLGVILYEMLVGHVPFTGPSPTAIMMKHLQEPAPSILTERPDLPETVGVIINRAMAKLPENRYRTAGELVEDLSIAAEAATALESAAPVETAQSNRTPHPEIVDDLDEQTLVRARPTTPGQRVTSVNRAPAYSPAPPRPAASGFRPWKILVPSLVGLLIVFAVVYAFTKGTESETASPTTPTLVADPNSQPVEPAKPPTGKDEVGIPAGGGASAPVANANVNANASPAPTDEININLNVNENTNAPAENANANANRKAPTVPAPSPGSTNTNERLEPPPPPTTKPSPNPTIPTPSASPNSPTDQ
jgi:serine/threonine-protein kinase